MSLLAALWTAAAFWLAARAAMAGTQGPRGLSIKVARKRWDNPRPSFQVWLSQAGAAVTPMQFCMVSLMLATVTFLLLWVVVQAPAVAALPAGAAGGAPFAYWSSQRRRQIAARSGAWPDALRYLVGVLGAGISTLHEALEELCASGPEALRGPMGRYTRLAGRLGSRQALETIRSELADPISDPVLLALSGAVEEGTGTALRVLSDLGSQITADIQLSEKVRTLQTQSRMATWGCFAMPYVLLMFLCATNAEYREFFSRPIGWAVLLIGVTASVIGFAVSRRMVRPIATTARVFANEGA